MTYPIPASQLAKLKVLKGQTERRVCKELARLAATTAQNRAIVEIGSYMGRSVCWMASAAPHGVPIICIDIWTAGEHEYPRYMAQEALDTFWRQTTETGVADRITTVQGDSLEVFTSLWPQIEDAAGIDGIGLLFLDGYHTYDHTVEEIRTYGSRVVSGGYIALHDAAADHHGVKKAIEDVLRPDPAWTDHRFLPWRKHPERRGLHVARKV
jgi:predicted O-methyltransferase YrrM